MAKLKEQIEAISRSKPTFTIDIDEIPEAKDWEMGETYEVEVEVKMVGHNKSSYDKGRETVTFEVEEMEAEDEDGDEEDKEKDTEDKKISSYGKKRENKV